MGQENCDDPTSRIDLSRDGSENCSQVACWIIDGRRGEWTTLDTTLVRYMVLGVQLVVHVTTMVVELPVPSQEYPLPTRLAGVPAPCNHSRTCPLTLQRRLALLTRSHQVLFFISLRHQTRESWKLLLSREEPVLRLFQSLRVPPLQAGSAPFGDERPGARLRS